MRRHLVRPYGHSISATRALSLIMSLALLWMLYSWMREPATWQWLAPMDDPDRVVVPAPEEAAPVVPAPNAPAKVEPKKAIPEVVVPGPNDLDQAELKDFQSKLELITDRAVLRPREMSLYWRLMGWSRTEPFKKLEQRADATTTFSQVWEQPSKYRGKLLRLRMHVRRVLKYTAPDNPLKLKDAYEAWGWTDDSKSYPYVVVFPELPPGLPVGPDVRGEVVFVGYFLKVMSYTAFDVSRGAPLLVGRVRLAAPRATIPTDSSLSIGFVIAAIVGAAICAGIAIRHLLTFRRKPPVAVLPENLDNFGAFTQPQPDESSEQSAFTTPNPFASPP